MQPKKIYKSSDKSLHCYINGNINFNDLTVKARYKFSKKNIYETTTKIKSKEGYYF